MPPATASRSKRPARKPAKTTAKPARKRSAAVGQTRRSAPDAAQLPAIAPPAEAPHPARLAGLREILAAQGLSHILITDPRDVGYLTGFLGGDSYLIVPADSTSKPVLISDFRYQEELAHFEPLARIVIRKTTMIPCVAETFGAEGISRCGVQGDHMTLSERDALLAQIEQVSGSSSPDRLVTTRGILLGMRRIKDQTEIAHIRRAIQIQQAALMELLPTIKPGQTESAIAARLEAAMKTRGSVEPAFTSIVAAKANSSLPHYRPADARTARGNALLIDWGAMWEGYRGDMTRTFCLGKWPSKLREIYRIVLDAHILSADALRAGRTTAEIDKIARDHIAKSGYGEYFGHGLGHGIGINIHEEPRLTQQVAPSPLEAGNVLTIEPGIYLPGVGGVRLENDYLVTATGSECLCTLPMHIEWSTLG